MKPQPIAFVWRELTGIIAEPIWAMVPLQRYVNAAKSQFGKPGTQHVLEPVSIRNMRFHNWYFAELHELYVNLPEDIADRWEDFDHFRKWILVNRTKWYEEREVVDGQTIRIEDAYSFVRVHDNKTIIRKARSQSTGAMSPEDFKESANDVLAVAREFVGVSAADARQASKTTA